MFNKVGQDDLKATIGYICSEIRPGTVQWDNFYLSILASCLIV